jgi:hypothetical protein
MEILSRASILIALESPQMDFFVSAIAKKCARDAIAALLASALNRIQSNACLAGLLVARLHIQAG